MASAPLLSIGIIFKNEECCIKRCLQSLEPLRKAIPCELVMADTGAIDGSRAIAEQYADEVFDFAWVDDFAAARNAVMDRCTGKWYLTIDCDEWLDADISELLAFLQGQQKADFGYVVQRNYHSENLEQGEEHNDFCALRLVRLSTGQRYVGAIHESWLCYEPTGRLMHTVLHHDGYLYADPEQEKRKLRRNMTLLRRELEKDPENLRTLLQCIDSSKNSSDHIPYIRRAVDVLQSRRSQWEPYGGVVLRNAVEAAREHELPELDEWLAYAEKEFSDSIFVHIDANNTAFRAACDAQKWEKAVRYGEAYRKGLQILRAAHPPPRLEDELRRDSVNYAHPDAERTLLIGLADAYCQAKQGKKALQTLAELDGAAFDARQVRNYVIALCRLHAQTMEDAAPVLAAFYEQISREEPGKQKQQARLAAFDAIAAACFSQEYQNEENKLEGYHRPGYTVFVALADKCEAGRAAAILITSDPAEMRALLTKVEDWQALPIEALEHALQAGAAFPLEEKPLPIEVMDGLAARMTHGENMARQMALAQPEAAAQAAAPGPDAGAHTSLQSLFWGQSLLLAALQSFDWSLGKNDAPVSKFARPEKSAAAGETPECTAEEGLALIRRFAQAESTLLPLLYTPQALAEENAALLPPMHRWGLFCAQALAVLDAGKPQEYLAALRRGLAACPGQKEMVQFLLDRFQEDARPAASPELLALAEKVRTILAAYDPVDPAVAALKASPAYQQVAWLIEDTNAGGMPS